MTLETLPPSDEEAASIEPVLQISNAPDPDTTPPFLEENSIEPAPQIIQAPDLETEPPSFIHRFMHALVGTPIATDNAIHQRIGKVKALALLSSDALSSVAYGTEASLAILVAAGLGFASYNLFIGLVIIALLAIVAFSYRQTIKHYPTGGGSYIVAKAHLGVTVGLVAAAALLLDYVLTVSVSVSAGVDALTSAFQPLIPYSVVLGLLFIGLIMLINIRGVRESGSIFAVPTYLFVGTYLLTLLAGLGKAVFSRGGLFTALPEQATRIQVTDHLSILLLLTAFASGCSAMTGTEAIADGVPVFKGANPASQSRNAAATLTIMAALLATMYGGTTYLAWRFGISPQLDSHPTLLSQIATFIWGNSAFGAAFYYLFQFATTLILILAANTSFSDFPRLSSILARDDYMPHSFALRGGRLAFTTGIVVLGVLASLLLVVFKGRTEALINLYALGVFTAFTLSQLGMMMHWREHKEPHWRRGAAISAFGALVTGLVTVVIMISKAPRGAWVVMILIPLFVLMFKRIHRHYAEMREHVAHMPVSPLSQIQHLMIVPFASLDQIALQGMVYARSISKQVIAVHIALEEDHGHKVRDGWNAWLKTNTRYFRTEAQSLQGEQTATQPELLAREQSFNGSGVKVTSIVQKMPGVHDTMFPELVIIDSPYRILSRALLKFIDKTTHDRPDALITVVLPEFVTDYWWERILHNQTALRLKFALLSRPHVVTTDVPYRHEHAPQPGKPEIIVAAQEEPQPLKIGAKSEH